MSIDEKLANVVCLVISTHIRSKEDSHLKSIIIHKVMCVYVTCNNSLKLFNLPSQKLGSIKNLTSYWSKKKIIDHYSFTFITNVTFSQKDTFYAFNKDSFFMIVLRTRHYQVILQINHIVIETRPFPQKFIISFI